MNTRSRNLCVALIVTISSSTFIPYLFFFATCRPQLGNSRILYHLRIRFIVKYRSRSFLYYGSSECVVYRSAKVHYANTRATWLLCGNSRSSGCQGSLHTPTRWACKRWSCVSNGMLGDHLYHGWSFLSWILLLAYHPSAIYVLHAFASFASRFLGNSNIDANTTTNAGTTRGTMFSAHNQRCIQWWRRHTKDGVPSLPTYLLTKGRIKASSQANLHLQQKRLHFTTRLFCIRVEA